LALKLQAQKEALIWRENNSLLGHPQRTELVGSGGEPDYIGDRVTLDLGTDNERLATSMGTMIKAVRAEPDDSVQYTLDILTRADQQADALKLSAGGRLFVKRLIQAANERCQEAGIVLPETKDLK